MKAIIKKILLNLAGWLIQTPLYKLFIIAAVRSVFFFQKYEDNDTKKSILILNHERFSHDLEALCLDKRVKLLILPSRIQTLLNSLFLNSNFSYQVNSYQNKKNETKKLVRFVVEFINKLNEKYNLCGIVTCSFYYRQDFPYQFASLKTPVPFYVIFKEYMKDESVVEHTIKNYKRKKFKFVGEKIFSANKNIEKILLESGVCQKSRISLVGSPRFDNIFKSNIYSNKYNKNKHTKKVVTFFSFLHSSGSIELKGSNNFFSDNGDGYYKLFRDVHKSVAELAVDNRDVQFIIKTKWGGIWFDKIVSSVLSATGIDILHQPNITLLSERNTQELIMKSSLVIAFNSTTVLESGLLGKNIIIPVYNEAKDKYYESNLFFKKYLDSLIIASSNKDLKDKVIKYLFDHKHYPLPKKMIKDFLIFYDGKSSKRILDIILQKEEKIDEK